MGVFDVKDPFGRPRFYPPGSHPALQTAQAALKSLRGFRNDLLDATLPSIEVDEAILYYEQQIVAFEQGESEAKMVYYERSRHDVDGAA